jgi:hypothetical protein
VWRRMGLCTPKRRIAPKRLSAHNRLHSCLLSRRKLQPLHSGNWEVVLKGDVQDVPNKQTKLTRRLYERYGFTIRNKRVKIVVDEDTSCGGYWPRQSVKRGALVILVGDKTVKEKLQRLVTSRRLINCRHLTTR